MLFFKSLTCLMFLQSYICAQEILTSNIYDFYLADSTMTCTPGELHTTGKITCICNDRGKWADSKCNNMFLKNNLEHRPQPKSRNSACVPNSYTIVNCNICYCNSNGDIDEERCTRNLCDPRDVSRRSSMTNEECDEGTWYSIAPCQFCYCANKNKLICNSRNHFTRTIKIGDHELRDCGKDFLEDAHMLLNDKKLKANNEDSKPTDTKTNIVDTADDATLYHIDVNNYDNKQISNTNGDKNSDIGVSSFENPERLEYVPDLSADVNEFKNKKLQHKPKKYMQNEPFLNLKKDLGKTLKHKIPKILDEVLKMAFRRNSLSIRSEPDCEPGAQTYVDCNRCVCLKNGKLLCSKMKCD